ncbi:MAG: hypothetical protein ABW047_01205 [Nitrospiraceae bacterium]
MTEFSSDSLERDDVPPAFIGIRFFAPNSRVADISAADAPVASLEHLYSLSGDEETDGKAVEVSIN